MEMISLRNSLSYRLELNQIFAFLLVFVLKDYGLVELKKTFQ